VDLVTIANDALSLSISPMGGEMQNLTTSDGREWLWNGDPAFWTGRAPILFPMVGRAPDDTLRIEGTPFSMPQHGFARRSVFTAAAADATSCRFELVDSVVTHQVYPFAFRLAVSYRLEDHAVAVAAEVSNTDQRPMPFGFGFHPAFRWPLPGQERQEHRVRLDNGAEPAMQRLEGGLVNPEVLPSPFTGGELVLEHAMFDDDAMVFPEGAGSGARLEAGDTALHVTWENLPNFAVWSKPGAAPFVCLEPWHGTAAQLGGSDALEERPGTVLLEPGGTARFSMRIEVVG
jgi:galactose mutarotase-like enzyme